MILVTTSEAAQLLPVSPSTIRTWASRGWTDNQGEHKTITPVDYRGRRRAPRYWLSDLQAAERDTRRKQRRSHRRTPCASLPA